jgi:hypothetical protein
VILSPVSTTWNTPELPEGLPDVRHRVTSTTQALGRQDVVGMSGDVSLGLDFVTDV